MKTFIKIFIVLIPVIIIFVGCNRNNNNSPNNTSENANMNNVITTSNDNYDYMEGRFPDKAWDATLIDEINSKEADPSNIVSDADSAILIATAEFEKLQREGHYKSYCLSGVFYDTVDQVWIVWYSKGQTTDTIITVGECYNIAISKNSGQIIQTWFGE